MAVLFRLIPLSGDARTREYAAWTRWLQTAAALTGRFATELADDPFAYNETASVSLLASAATMAGYLSLAEFGVTKGHRSDRRISADGRCDLWVATESTSWGFEFKQIRPERLTGLRALQSAMAEAVECAKCLRSDEADKRVAGLIVSLYWLDKSNEYSEYEPFRIFALECDYAWAISSDDGVYSDTLLFFEFT